MRRLAKKYSVILVLLISSFTLLTLSPLLLAQSKTILNKQIDIRVDIPTNHEPFHGFIVTFDNAGNPVTQKFNNPQTMADTLGINVDKVLNRVKPGIESTGSVSVTKSSNISATKLYDKYKAQHNIQSIKSNPLYHTSQSRIDAYAVLDDGIFPVYFIMNELDLSDTYNYNGTYVSGENAVATAKPLLSTGWYVASGPTINFTYALPTTSDYARSYTVFNNDTFPGVAPISNGIWLYDYVYGDGHADAWWHLSYYKNWVSTWRFWGAYSVTNLSGDYYPFFYRFYNGHDHFYTENYGEGSAAGYNYEGIACVLGLPNEGGTAPFYRSYNSSTGDHFYTRSWAEAHSPGYHYEGVAGYIYTSHLSGTVPLYRSFNPANGDHFYSKSWAEVHTPGYRYDGVAGYVRQ